VEIIYPRIAGIDVGKREVAVAVRLPGDDPGQRRQVVRKYKTFYPVLRQMAAWLMEQGVTHVAMEATGVYWKPVFHALCEAEQIEVLLVNARHVKNVPGRKSDLLTELRDRVFGRRGLSGVGVARFPVRDHRWGYARFIGFVGAVAGVGAGDGGSVPAVSAA
jgi:hypothetical protein